MRFPYHKWIQYLVLTKHTDKEVQGICRDIGLGFPGVVYLNSVRKDLLDGASAPLKKFLQAEDKSLVKMHRDDLKKAWVDDLDDFHAMAQDVEVAYSCFRDPRKRKHLDLYSMCSDVDMDKLISSFNHKFDADICDSVISEYMRFFFDVEEMNEADWKKFLRTLDPKDRKNYELAPGRKSPYVQWRIGDTVHISPDQVVRDIMSEFAMMYKDAAIHRNDGWEDTVCKFADMSLKASDRVSRNETSGASKKQQLLLLFSEQEQPIASYDELDQGDEEDPSKPDEDPS